MTPARIANWIAGVVGKPPARDVCRLARRLAILLVLPACTSDPAGPSPVAAVLLGVLTGVGGGMLRDVLVSEIPAVLRSELYAVAALAGASVVVLGHLLHLPPSAVAIAGAALCFGLRLAAIRRGWRLPIADPENHPTPLR